MPIIATDLQRNLQRCCNGSEIKIMASIRKKSNGMWLAQVRRVARDGLPALNRSASFPRKAEAEAWVAKIENE